MTVLESTAAAPPWNSAPAADRRQNRLFESRPANGVSLGQSRVIERDTISPQRQGTDAADGKYGG